MNERGGVNPRVFGIVRTILDDVRRHPRYTDRSVTVDEGVFGTRHIAKGGFYNADPDRATYGVTKADVEWLRREARSLGVRLTFDEADAILVAGVMGALYADRAQRLPASSPASEEAKREYWRQKRAAQRERAKALGYCIVCLKSPATEGKPTCADCREKNAARMARQRKQEREED